MFYVKLVLLYLFLLVVPIISIYLLFIFGGNELPYVRDCFLRGSCCQPIWSFTLDTLKESTFNDLLF